MPDRLAATRRVVRLDGGGARTVVETLAGEEPLEIRVDGVPVSVTMRTPGHDLELAVGWCLAEGLLAGPDDVALAKQCAGDGVANTYNVVDVTTRSGRPVEPALRRKVVTTSACGLCGATSIDAVLARGGDVLDDHTRVPASVVSSLPETVRAEQRLFGQTGGVHAAALATSTGDVLCVREDVGRHNAVDKVVGWAVAQGRLPLRAHVLFVSGRVAFEIVQKALIAQIPVVAAVSAPTTLAVELAEASGLTLAAFVRDGAMNVYAGAERITP